MTNTIHIKTLLGRRALKSHINMNSPNDIISPGVLTSGGTITFGGIYGVEQTNFALHWLAHMAVGESFLGMSPPRPLRVFYLQGRTEKQCITAVKKLAGGNLIISSDADALLHKGGTDKLSHSILCAFPNARVDIIAIETIESVESANKTRDMQDFERDKLEIVRKAVNPVCGIMLVRHMQQQKEQDMLYEFREATYLSSCDIRMLSAGGHPTRRMLYFGLKNRAHNSRTIKPKLIDKVDSKWCEVSSDVVRKKWQRRSDG